MNVDIKLTHPDAKAPTYATDGSGCFDFYSVDEFLVPGNSSMIFGTGLEVAVPENHVMLIFSRSGHGFKHDVRLSNCVGVIDSDYRGEIKIKLKTDHHYYSVNKGERIGQGIVIPYEKVNFTVKEELLGTERAGGGFGSTGR